ncbi:MAG: hypothetical protein CVU77_02155 [Elusimicrobia bacterium HGW-Elusimicrobia-1]|jgi:hypothetical protein|nr:MAG: hypothetical protein CVU77_02155 [Elusimicrobia bacterium HGW-Elusimicrobia-1]
MNRSPMKKKIFIIHGFGQRNGIGWEAGGDLDTVSSSVFYTAWARKEIEKAKGSPAVRGEDYDYDFVNYSEGLSHLVVHSGCDIYIPDFPIDALSPRLELMYIPDPSAVGLISDFNSKLFALKILIGRNALLVDDRLKKLFNSGFKQKTKVLEHSERDAIATAVACADIVTYCVEMSAALSAKPDAAATAYLNDVLSNIAGDALRSAKDYIIQNMGGFVKDEQMDELENPRDILKIEESNTRDFSAKGRVNYTDDFMIVSVESVAYAARNTVEAGALAYTKTNAERIQAASAEIVQAVASLFKNVKNVSDVFLASSASNALAPLAEKISLAASSAMDAALRAKNPAPAAASADGDKITALLMEQSSGRTVAGVKISLKRLLGAGVFRGLDGKQLGSGASADIVTGSDGSAAIVYVPGAPGEEYQISATYDDVKYLMIPEEIISAADSGAVEEALDDEDDDSRIDRAMSVSLQLLEKQFRFLAENDVTVESVTDHHPYTPAVHELIARLQKEGLVKEFNVRAAPRGQEEPVEKQVCGANIVFFERLSSSAAKTEGLSQLNVMARMQDLHIKMMPLAISLSKLIGSKFSKIEMALKLSELTDKKSLENIMASTGWDKVVADYERRLALVLPRAEANVMRMTFEREAKGLSAVLGKIFPSLNKKNIIEIFAALSAFCDPRKGEPQINVASAIGYIAGVKKMKTDYFFYCYGSNILTQRKMANSDERINLSTLSQWLGTKADGGHSGASTCKPVSNPSFPRKRLSNVKEWNFPEYLYYLAGKISESAGFPFKKLEPVNFDFSPVIRQSLERLDPTLVELVVKSGWMRKKIMFAKMPKPDYDSRDSNPSLVQVITYLRMKYRFDYLFLVQGAMSKIILANVGDASAAIDLVPVAKALGWQEDSGDPRFAAANPRRNKKISREWRFAKEERFFDLAAFLSGFVEQGLSDPSQKNKWKIHSLLSPPAVFVPKELDPFAKKFLRGAVFETRLIPADKKSKPLTVAFIEEPFVKGSRAPVMPLCIGLLRRSMHLGLYKYIVYMRYGAFYLINTGDDARSFDLSRIAKNLDANYSGFSPIFASVDRKTAVMPTGYEKMTRDNQSVFITKLLEKLFGPAGYKTDKIEKKGA